MWQWQSWQRTRMKPTTAPWMLETRRARVPLDNQAKENFSKMHVYSRGDFHVGVHVQLCPQPTGVPHDNSHNTTSTSQHTLTSPWTMMAHQQVPIDTHITLMHGVGDPPTRHLSTPTLSSLNLVGERTPRSQQHDLHNLFHCLPTQHVLHEAFLISETRTNIISFLTMCSSDALNVNVKRTKT